MFGLFKKKLAPEGPVQFVAELVIDRPCEEVYPLLDWADPRNAKVQLGNVVTPIAGVAGRYHMVMPRMADLDFHFTVTEAVPHRAYAFDCLITPNIGRLVSSHEAYDMVPEGAGGCRLAVTITANFIDGMTMKELKQEVQMMGLACHNALIKLKMHAEMELEMVQQIEAEQFA